MSESVSDPDTSSSPEASELQTPAKAPRRRSWLRISLSISLSVFLLLLVAIIWVLGTQSGLRFSLALVQELAPGLLEVEQVDGRILGDLHLKRLQVQAPGLELKLRSLDLRWSPLAAVTGTLRISELTARELDIATASALDEEEEEAESGPISLPQLELPLRLELEQALVENLSIGTLGEDARFRVDRIALVADWMGSALTLKELSIALPEPLVNANARGKAELTGDYPLDLGLDWDLSQAPALALKGTATVGGDLKRLRVEHDLTGSAEVKLQALVQGVLNDPRWDGKLRILSVDLPSIQADLPAVNLSGELTTSGNLQLARIQGHLTGDAPDLPDFGQLTATLDVTWAEQVLEIVALEMTEDKSGALLTAGGRLDLNDSAGAIDLQAAWEKLRWPLTGELIAEARQGKLDVAGTLEAFAYQVSAEVWGKDFPEAKLQLTGQGTKEATRIEGLRIQTMDGEVQGEGRVAWAPELGWELTLSGAGINPGVQWPELPAKIGLEVTSEGTLDAFEYRVATDLKSEALPAATLELSGKGDVKSTRIEALRLETLGGHLEGEADVGWDPAVSWDAKLDAAQIDPGKHWPEWVGLLGGRVLSQGKLEEAGPNLRAEIESLAGELRGYPVDAAVLVQMKAGEIQLDELRLASGPSNLRAAGSIGDRLDLEFGLSSPDLASLLPDAQGRVKASGTVGGTLDAPAVKFGLAADDVAVAGQRIQSLAGNANLDLAPGGLMQIDLTGKGLKAGETDFDSLRVQGDGDMGAHRLSARLTGESLSLDLNATGGLKADNAYAGQLTGLELGSPQLGNWRLQKAAPLALAGATISAGPICIREKEGSGGCASFDQEKAGSWRASLDLDRLAFGLLKDLIPEGMLLEGEVQAKADFQAAGGALAGNARVQVPKGLLRREGETGPALVDFTSANLAVDAGGKGLQAKLAVPLAGLGDLSGDVSLPGWTLQDPARPGQALRGEVRARVEDLGVLSRFVPDITNLTGDLNADFKLAGTIAKPGLSGSAKLANGGLEVPLIGLKVEDMTFDADASSLERVTYRGGFKAGEGRLNLEGQSQMAAQGLITSIKAKGEKLKLADSKEYFVLASLDVDANIEPTGTHLTGTVTVPEARIRPRNIPEGSVTTSSDVVLASKATEEQSRYATSLDLRLEVRKGVTVRAFGLEGGIAGKLAVLQAPGKEILGDGELKIVDGTYRISTGSGVTAAFGKPLKIEQGFLTYAKSPINNPFLVLTAQREGGDTTAGIRVFGTIKKPKLTFFSSSDPGMSQSEVTKYLLTGIPPKRDGDEPADRAVSVGTYVAPKLFAEYDYALGDESDKIRLRYDLNDWIELQTETGDSQGGDIFFKIEN